MHFEEHERLLTIAEASRILGLRPGTLRLWQAQGRLGRIKLGKRAVRVRLSELLNLIERGESPARRADR
jgi:excisionase family DNA binding protein